MLYGFTSDVFPMLLHCKTVPERKDGWKGWVLPAPLGDSWDGGGTQGIQESKTRKDVLGRGWSTELPHHSASSTGGRSPAGQTQTLSSVGGEWVGLFVLHSPGKVRR